MDILKIIWDEIIAFFALRDIITIVKSGNYSSFLTLTGILFIIRAVLPWLIIIEVLRNVIYRKFNLVHYKLPFFSYVFIAVIGRIIPLTFTLVLIGFFSKYMLFEIPFTWYGFLLGYIIYEFANFVHHYLGHKVRLLWCLHSVHHAPEAMNLSVSFNRFFLEQTYMDFVRVSICIVLGMQPPMLFMIMLIDGIWGVFVHIGEDFFPNGRMGFLEKIVITPSHHRVHHARNPLYRDTNFCVLLNVWDKIFKTYQPLKDEVPVEYGITRPVNANNFADVMFGEIVALYKDIKSAPGVKNKIMYLIMPPGWSHTGNDKTAKKERAEFINNQTTRQ